jgi:excisionase family DNA binding protein
MIIPDNIIEPAITLKDQYFDLPGLARYCSLKVPTLRSHISSGDLPAFKVKGKILIKKSEFDSWLERYRVNKKRDLDNIVAGILSDVT